MDAADGSDADASEHRDVDTDTEPPSDTDKATDTSDSRTDTEDATIIPPPDGSERRDTSDEDVGFVCPAPREIRGVCGSPVYCCKNKELQKKCQYGQGCEIPETIDQDPNGPASQNSAVLSSSNSLSADSSGSNSPHRIQRGTQWTDGPGTG
jgi:hypothetical protein